MYYHIAITVGSWGQLAVSSYSHRVVGLVAGYGESLRIYLG